MTHRLDGFAIELDDADPEMALSVVKSFLDELVEQPTNPLDTWSTFDGDSGEYDIYGMYSDIKAALESDDPAIELAHTMREYPDVELHTQVYEGDPDDVNPYEEYISGNMEQLDKQDKEAIREAFVMEDSEDFELRLFTSPIERNGELPDIVPWDPADEGFRDAWDAMEGIHSLRNEVDPSEVVANPEDANLIEDRWIVPVDLHY